MQVCKAQPSQTYLSILQSITQLRRVCNHGISERIASPKGPTGVLNDDAMDVDVPEEGVINLVDLLESLEAIGKDTCANCDTKITSLITTHTESTSIDIGYLTKCSHLICATCRPQVLILTGRDATEQYCTLCRETSDTVHVHTFDNTTLGPADTVAPIYNPDHTVPTKIRALLADIEANTEAEKR